MKTILFAFAIFFACTNVLSQKEYKSKDKIFKSIRSWKLEKFKTEFEKLNSSGVNLDSVYYVSVFNNDEGKVYKNVGIIDEVLMLGSLETLAYLYSQKLKFSNFENSINRSYPYLISQEYGDEMFQFVLDQGADINAQCRWCGENSPLQIAIHYEKFDLAQTLLDKGANSLLLSENNESILMESLFADSFNVELFDRLLLETKPLINTSDNDGYTALSYALESGNIYASKKLLAAGAALSLDDQPHLIS